MLKQNVSSHHDDESETKNDTSVEVQKASPKTTARSLRFNAFPTCLLRLKDQGKAKAFDKLAAFYDACAQVEIDEYRDYDKVCCLMWLDGLVG